VHAAIRLAIDHTIQALLRLLAIQLFLARTTRNSFSVTGHHQRESYLNSARCSLLNTASSAFAFKASSSVCCSGASHDLCSHHSLLNRWLAFVLAIHQTCGHLNSRRLPQRGIFATTFRVRAVEQQGLKSILPSRTTSWSPAAYTDHFARRVSCTTAYLHSPSSSPASGLLLRIISPFAFTAQSSSITNPLLGNHRTQAASLVEKARTSHRKSSICFGSIKHTSSPVFAVHPKLLGSRAQDRSGYLSDSSTTHARIVTLGEQA
jgi:hypothetical protein